MKLKALIFWLQLSRQCCFGFLLGFIVGNNAVCSINHWVMEICLNSIWCEAYWPFTLFIIMFYWIKLNDPSDLDSENKNKDTRLYMLLHQNSDSVKACRQGWCSKTNVIKAQSWDVFIATGAFAFWAIKSDTELCVFPDNISKPSRWRR